MFFFVCFFKNVQTKVHLYENVLNSQAKTNHLAINKFKGIVILDAFKDHSGLSSVEVEGMSVYCTMPTHTNFLQNEKEICNKWRVFKSCFRQTSMPGES